MFKNKKTIFYLFIFILFTIFIITFIIQYNRKKSKNFPGNNQNNNINYRANKVTEKNFEIYKKLDHPEITSLLFHPRPDDSHHVALENLINLTIQVDSGVTIGANFFSSSRNSPTILFFHGNGEIVSDYNDLGPVYNKMGMNFSLLIIGAMGNLQENPMFHQ